MTWVEIFLGYQNKSKREAGTVLELPIQNCWMIEVNSTFQYYSSLSPY